MTGDMSRRREEEREFEELQRRKKRRLEANRRRREGEPEPDQLDDIEVRPKKKKVQQSKSQKNKAHKEIKRKKTIVVPVQAAASIIFMLSLLILNMLPLTFLTVIGVLLLILIAAVTLTLRSRRKKRTPAKAASLIISFILLIGSFYVLKGYTVLGDISRDNPISDVQVQKESFVVYISGIDVYGDVAQDSRSDVNMLAVVNPNTYQILLVTTPRDYYVEIPGVSDGEKDKLTHAGLYGINASKAALAQLYDTDIDFNVRVNFTSMIDIVDALGGVNVNSEVAFTTSAEAGHVMDIKEGKNHLNGVEALAFSRERKNLVDGDNQRGKNQQAVITAMLRKMMSPAIVVSANGILNSVKDNAETNMAKSQIQAITKAYFGGGGKWTIKSVAADSTPDSRYCFSYSGGPLSVAVPDDSSVENIKAVIHAVKNGEMLEDAEKL